MVTEKLNQLYGKLLLIKSDKDGKVKAISQSNMVLDNLYKTLARTLSKIDTNTTFTITHVQLGKGVQPANREQTALEQLLVSAPIRKVSVTQPTNPLVMSCYFEVLPNTGLQGNTVSELGLYDNNNSKLYTRVLLPAPVPVTISDMVTGIYFVSTSPFSYPEIEISDTTTLIQVLDELGILHDYSA